MKLFKFLISKNFLEALNEDLSAVHYSIVTPGIDSEIKPGTKYTLYFNASQTRNKLKHKLILR